MTGVMSPPTQDLWGRGKQDKRAVACRQNSGALIGREQIQMPSSRESLESSPLSRTAQWVRPRLAGKQL